MATTMQLVTAIARAKAEILNDVGRAVSSTGATMPLYPRSFSELHDYVDANTYGGMCDDDLFDDLWPHSNEITGALDGWLGDRVNAAHPDQVPMDRNPDDPEPPVDALPTDFLRDGHTLILASIVVPDEGLLVDGDRPERPDEVAMSVRARLTPEAGYLSDGGPIMPTDTTVVVIGGTPEGGYGR